MAGALECWSSRASTDEDIVEQVLMRTHDRSETSSSSTTEAASLQLPDQSSNLSLKDTISSSSAMQKKLQRLSRNVSEAIASLKNSLNLDSPRDSQVQLTSSQQGNCSGNKSERCRKVVWASVVRNLTQLYPGSQLPEKLVSNIRKHYDSLPLSYAQAGFDMKEVFMHMKMIEQALVDEQPAIMIQEVSDDEIQGAVYKLTFACNSSISWPVMSGALDSASICCKKIQIFEKKGFTLGVVLLLVQAGQAKSFKARIENALKSSVKKSKSTTVKLPFGLCGCQEENIRGNFGEIEEDPCEQNSRNGIENPNVKIQLEMPLPTSSIVVAVDEWQTINSGGDELGKWLLNSDNLEFIDQIGPSSFKGVYKGKRVGIEKLKACDKGNSYEFELRKDLLELMTCGHKNIHQFYGICVDENHGLCVVTKLMEGGSVNELMLKNKKLQPKEIMRIATDVAEGMRFMNDHGVAYRDLNTQRILLDRHGNACLGDMGIVTVCKSMGEAMEYETDGYRWLAPEIIAGDPENITETWMSNAYSFGMVVWEMVTGEAAYAAYSPVQAAVGIAACGLRPEIPKDCLLILRSLMTKCWNNSPSKRPQFSEILSILLRPNNQYQ
ncbi:PREDICTED: probable LRR receptor-like serine/threonine-protein kinase At1g12460 [Populus euphratica]|uniref:Probable LRR receptor-like serine/threonine-protein kinase At1g12460 n=1 Tax=Populus euphratica TaxID=75702 RepID=A0AAJ6T2V9_POPEU|nr:PREDICTED: probable LRR receptor-like serine/threonine-protein kinase At1g12460 [Populus euphratica]XP_011003603.1 PREDICTED: probable LRR receptor-like serine/threonine-protein kinase At1g12460 [Populus euphratica]XP_011003610.1 PREDICTED: probable LRR receptor-like serine/threonine-protein kinase At1g12460 [Populus euphratica]